MLFPILEPSNLPIVVVQPDKRHANRTAFVLEWYERHRAYSKTAGSNEEEEALLALLIHDVIFQTKLIYEVTQKNIFPVFMNTNATVSKHEYKIIIAISV